MPESAVLEKLKCTHCGEPCDDEIIHQGDAVFCCTGCQTVFGLLNESGLGAYYGLDKDQPGINMRKVAEDTRFEYLDDPSVQHEILDFSDGQLARVTLKTPQIHCASCIWLLENLHRLNPAVKFAQVYFDRREVAVRFDIQELPLSKLAALLSSIGYTPDFSLDRLETKKKSDPNRPIYLKIGIAGFAFGNIMLFSLPEYLAGSGGVDAQFLKLFGALNIALALPVFLYSSLDFFKPALMSVQQRQWSMDIAISLGIIAMFFRSLYEIAMGLSIGYMDSFTMLVFLLLVGRLFQRKTYETLSFERDYKSYFPLSVIRLDNAGVEHSVAATRIEEGDTVVIRNGELLPADAMLLEPAAAMDFSFVTGESEPISVKKGDLVYAGGRNTGTSARFLVSKPVSGSYLTRLWNNEEFRKSRDETLRSLSQRFSRYFSPAVLAIAALSAIYWMPSSPATAINAFTAVLIVACPCALALSAPFTLGWATNLMSRARLYLKNGEVIEHLASVDTIVFDKTGTLTEREKGEVRFVGRNLSDSELQAVTVLLHENTHPLGRQIFRYLSGSAGDAAPRTISRPFEATSSKTTTSLSTTKPALTSSSANAENTSLATAFAKTTNPAASIGSTTISGYTEVPGKGVKADIDGVTVMAGSASWVGAEKQTEKEAATSRVYIRIGGETAGYFEVRTRYRQGIHTLLKDLKGRINMYLLSGDNDKERANLSEYFDQDKLLFEQSPHDKLEVIRSLRSTGKGVLMIGDGLNDAGALRSSTVGVSLAEDTSSFTPASDVIMDAASLTRLDRVLDFARSSKRIIYVSFAISVLYNIVGLGFAVTGTLSPLICAIIMPISSVSVIAWTTAATHWSAWRKELYQ
jgi:P-type Cu+ transporter